MGSIFAVLLGGKLRDRLDQIDDFAGQFVGGVWPASGCGLAGSWLLLQEGGLDESSEKHAACRGSGRAKNAVSHVLRNDLRIQLHDSSGRSTR